MGLRESTTSPRKRKRRKPPTDVPSAFQDLISGLDMSALSGEDDRDN